MSQQCTSNTNRRVATLSADAHRNFCSTFPKTTSRRAQVGDRWPVYSIDDRQLAVNARTSK
jgi:hypothetical protein